MLRAKDISFRYPQEGHGLPPISLEVRPGELALVTGPSGCGKSTLARCLMGLIPHLYHGELSGEVWLNGYPTSETPIWKLAEVTGMVFQNPAAQMLAPSVEEEIIFGLENLGLSRSEIKSHLETVLREFDLEYMRDRNPQTLSGGEQQRLALAAIMARLPDPDLNYYRWLISALGLEPYENTPPLLLSEGEKKRLALGLVLMRRPAHGLLLDEPSLGQDQAYKNILVRLLRTMAQTGQLVVITTHDLTLASQADRLILLGPAGVIANGPTDEILVDQATWERTGLTLPGWSLKGRKSEAGQ